jgi:transcriptional regulator with XRE-family HTH domain
MPRYRIGKLIRRERRRARMSLLALADESGVPPATLQRLETNSPAVELKLEQLDAIARVLGLGLARLLADAKEG